MITYLIIFTCTVYTNKFSFSSLNFTRVLEKFNFLNIRKNIILLLVLYIFFLFLSNDKKSVSYWESGNIVRAMQRLDDELKIEETHAIEAE